MQTSNKLLEYDTTTISRCVLALPPFRCLPFALSLPSLSFYLSLSPPQFLPLLLYISSFGSLPSLYLASVRCHPKWQHLDEKQQSIIIISFTCLDRKAFWNWSVGSILIWLEWIKMTHIVVNDMSFMHNGHHIGIGRTANGKIKRRKKNHLALIHFYCAWFKVIYKGKNSLDLFTSFMICERWIATKITECKQTSCQRGVNVYTVLYRENISKSFMYASLITHSVTDS